MNYYDAREIQADGKGTGKWHYTSFNRRLGTRPVGHCADHEGHDTPEQARNCFRHYLIAGWREVGYGDWTECAWSGCEAPTKKGLSARPPLGNDYPLCDDHRPSSGEDVVAVLNKLMPEIGQITASY